MYSHILVPLDGSPFAEQVLPHVEEIARRFGSRVTLIQSIAEDASAAEMSAAQAGTLAPAVTTIPPPADEDVEQTALTYLRLLQRRLRDSGVAVDYREVEGAAAEAIIDQARATSADLIAMTTHGRSGLSRLYYGSVAEAVLRQAPCPVLLVRMHEGVGLPRR